MRKKKKFVEKKARANVGAKVGNNAEIPTSISTEADETSGEVNDNPICETDVAPKLRPSIPEFSPKLKIMVRYCCCLRL